MNLFHPHNPKITAADRGRLSPHLGNAKYVQRWLKTNPTLEDVRRAIILVLDADRSPMGRGILLALLRRHRNIEASILEGRILTYLNSKR